jgi:hypothetical protein
VLRTGHDSLGRQRVVPHAPRVESMPLAHRCRQLEMVKGGFRGLKNDLSGGMVCPTRGQSFLVSCACL